MPLTLHDTLDADGRLVTTVTVGPLTTTYTRTPAETQALLRLLAHGLGYGLVVPQDAIPYDCTTLTDAQIAAATGAPTWQPLPTAGEEVLRPEALNGAAQDTYSLPPESPVGVSRESIQQKVHVSQETLSEPSSVPQKPHYSDDAFCVCGCLYESHLHYEGTYFPCSNCYCTRFRPRGDALGTRFESPPLQPCWAALQARLRSQGQERDEATCRALCEAAAIPPESQAALWEETLGRAMGLARVHDREGA